MKELITYEVAWNDSILVRLNEGPPNITFDTGIPNQSGAAGAFTVTSGTIRNGDYYSSSIQRFEDSLNTNTLSGNTYSVIFQPEQGRVVISRESGPSGFTLTFLDENAKLLGFTLGASASVNNMITGSRFPWYMWREDANSRSKWNKDFQPEPFHYDYEADDGTCYSIGKSASATYSDWQHQLLPQSYVRKANASLEQPYTWQHLVEDAGPIQPLCVHTGALSAYTELNKEHFYKLRSEANVTNFNPTKHQEDFEDFLNVDVKTRIIDGDI